MGGEDHGHRHLARAARRPGHARLVDSAVAYFTTGGALALPAAIAVSYWDGRELVPVRNLTIDWATGSNQPTTLSFDAVRSSQLRLDMTSAAPNTGGGFLMIAELGVRSNGREIH